MTQAPRAHRVTVTEGTALLSKPDYASAFEVAATDDRTPEEWARAVFEAAPPVVRGFVLAGWRYVLGFRLGPRPSAAHVLGWRIVATTADAITLEVRSALVTAVKVLRVENSQVVMTTFVQYERRIARVVWSSVAPVHHRTEPYLLGHAARR